MQIRGKIVSISGNVAEVCILKENTVCGICSTCPKKMGIQDIVSVASIKGIHVGQEVVVRDNTYWFTKHKIVFTILAFVLGIIIAEAISTIVSFGAYRKEVDILVGCVLTAAVSIVLWTKKPKFPFRIELIEGGKT